MQRCAATHIRRSYVGVIFTQGRPPGSHRPRLAERCFLGYSSPSLLETPRSLPAGAVGANNTGSPTGRCDHSVVGELLVTVRAKPGSSWDRVSSAGGLLVVAVTAPAVDGRANEAVVRVLAKALHLRAGLVRVKSGARSRTKVISIEVTAESAPAITERLAALLGQIGAP